MAVELVGDAAKEAVAIARNLTHAEAAGSELAVQIPSVCVGGAMVCLGCSLVVKTCGKHLHISTLIV